LLAYPGSDESVARVPVTPGAARSPLSQLHAVSTRLAGRYGWRDYQATWFVLTGRPPLVWPLDVEDFYVNERPVAIRVVAAPWVPARAVMEAYRRTQKTMGTPGQRPLSARRQALLDFIAQTPPGSHRQRLAAWNAEQSPRSQWRYSDVRRFMRHVKAAERHLTTSAFRLDLA
jgi:hypothetical protein